MSTPTREQLLRAALAKRLQEQARQRSATVDDSPIPVADRDQPLPLSFAQQRLWFLARMEGFSEAYHMALALRLHGALDVHALRDALDRIVSRHEALRTTFHRDGDDPVQRIAPPDCGFSLQEHDLRGHPHADEALAQRILEEAHEPFDMARGPLFRGQLVRMADDGHVLLLTMHHVISDAWSLGLLSTELAALYRHHREGGDDPLPPLPVQYADYALWQRQWLAGDVLEKQTDYWRRTLAGAPTLLELPTDRPRPAQQAFAGDRVPIVLDAALSDALKALSRRHGMTLFMTVLAAWATVLSRLSGQADVVVGTPVANRRRPEVANLVGFFVNTLALRVDVSGSVSELLDRVKSATLDAQDHQELPFEQVVEIVKPPRSLAHSPIFQAMLAWQDMNEGTVDLGGVTMTPLDTLYDTAKFDLTLNLGESGDRIVGGLDYATALFDRTTIERHAGYLQRVLAAMVADETQPVDRIDLPDTAERRALLALGDGGPGLAGDGIGLYDLVAAQAARTPDAVAVVEPGAELTYRTLTQRANGLAEQLRALGAGPESRVAILTDRSAESIVGLLAILAAGAAYVPLDPGYPDDRLGYVLDDAAVLALVAPSKLANRATACASLRPALAGRILDIGQAPTRDAPPAVALRPEHAAYVIYTSGSTGVPKGVVLEHRGVMNLVQGFIARHDFAGQRLLMIPPLIFDASVGDVFPALATGAALVLHPDPTELGPEALSRFCSEHRITAIDAPAALWRQWTEGFIDLQAENGAPVLPDLTLMMFGGEGVSLEQVRRFAKLTGGRVALSNHYGPTEASVCATMLTTRDGAELAGAKLDGAELPIGRALPGVRVHVLDRHLQLAPTGVEGELCIGGVQVAREYLNRPDLTADRFVRDPFAPDDAADADARLYRTGDLARWNADGTLQFVGRRDHQVKIRGFRIELSEIEVCLAQYPGVREVAVLAREDVPGDKRLVAYLVAGEAIDAEALRTHLGGRLPEYMVPAAYVRLDALPLTVNGKLDRKALPAPDASAYVTRQYEAPEGDTETSLATIWAKVLKLERVGRHDNFFEVGGHSLSAIGLVAALQKHFDAQISDVFRWPTVFEQAQHFKPSRDALRQRIERVKQSLAAAEERHRQTLEDPALQARFDAYRTRTDQEMARLGVQRTVPYGCVLLTGATGYLGAYLLHALVTTRDCRIVAPVRGADLQDAERRLHEVLDHYFGPAFHALCAGRVEVVVADLAQPGLGMAPDSYRRLATEVDTILHSAANVSHYGAYEDFHRANVVATEQLLALAVEGTPKRFHFVSTISTADGVLDAPWSVFTEHDIDIGQQPGNVYVRSKLEAERAVGAFRARGGVASIHRVGNITYHSRTGVLQKNIAENAFYQRTRACIALGVVPEYLDVAELTFVDQLARAIVLLCEQDTLANETFHLRNPRLVRLAAFLAESTEGLPMRSVASDAFLDSLLELRDQPEYADAVMNLLLHTGLLEEEASSARPPLFVLAERTERLLAGLGFDWPEPDPAAIRRLVQLALDGADPGTPPPSRS
jgi:amino acid adenylation domain-containing protein/thioester reductase-like protein